MCFLFFPKFDGSWQGHGMGNEDSHKGPFTGEGVTFLMVPPNCTYTLGWSIKLHDTLIFWMSPWENS